MEKVGVIGSGSWGTAIVKMLCENLKEVHWCVRDEYVKGYLEHNLHNPKYLTSIEFHLDQLKITTNIDEIVNECDFLIFTTPSIYLKQLLDSFSPNFEGKFVFSAIKGIVPETLEVVCDFLMNKYKIPKEQIGIISGPCHAEEVALERQAYLTVGAYDSSVAEKMGEFLSSDYIITNISNDVIGIEYAAVLKNIYSIACGIAHGLNFGDNFQAVLMSNSIRELNHYVHSVSPSETRDICQSAYLGDLLVTGYSIFSRNRMLGTLIGKGYTVKSAILEMNMVAEGYYAVKGLIEADENKAEIELPIAEAVYKILHKEKDPKKTFGKLLQKLN